MAMSRFRVCACAVVAGLVTAGSAVAHDDGPAGTGKAGPGPADGAVGGPFPTNNMEVLSHLPIADIGGEDHRGNDIWGWTWTDPQTQAKREFALMGLENGTSFIEVTDPTTPVYLGILPSHTGNSIWRDVKVYSDHAYVVSDGNGSHGMQVFDLTQLTSVVGPPQMFTETAHLAQFSNAHNIAINEDTGYAYVAGANLNAGGLTIINLNVPDAPVMRGGYSLDGYTHDTQVVTYTGPDADYFGQEIAFSSNTDTLTIVDVTVKDNVPNAGTQISKTSYPNFNYVHQGWLTEDQRYFLSNDETDELNVSGVDTTLTHMWDLVDLDNPLYMGFYDSGLTAIDHNLYTHNGLVYQANYTTGVRVLDYSDIANGNLVEVASIDTHPTKDDISFARGFDGAWSVYPYFDSGTIIISDREEGLIVTRLTIANPPYVAGDSNRDGVVDLLDLVVLAGNFGQAGDFGWAGGDFNGDDLVDADDLSLMQGNLSSDFGQSFESFAEQLGLIPEPASAIFLIVGGALVAYRRPHAAADGRSR